MKFYLLSFLLAGVVFVECNHTFLGTNVMRDLVFHKDAYYPSRMFQKTIEYINYTLPYYGRPYGQTIHGILAYDMKHSSASVNVTRGGIGYPYVTLRLKSERASSMHYDIYIYA